MISNRRFITTLYMIAPPQSMGHSLTHPISFSTVDFGREARPCIGPDPVKRPRITGRSARVCLVTFPDTPRGIRFLSTIDGGGKTLRQNDRGVASIPTEANSPSPADNSSLSLWKSVLPKNIFCQESWLSSGYPWLAGDCGRLQPVNSLPPRREIPEQCGRRTRRFDLKPTASPWLWCFIRNVRAPRRRSRNSTRS